MTAKTAKRIACPFCHRSVSVNNQNRIAPHTVTGVRGGTECKESGRFAPRD